MRVVRTRLDCDLVASRPHSAPTKLGPGRVLIMSSGAALLTPSVDDTSAAERRPEVVVNTTPSSIAALPAAANSPQLFEPTESECASFATNLSLSRGSPRNHREHPVAYFGRRVGPRIAPEPNYVRSY